jgi:hypothetical protein
MSASDQWPASASPPQSTIAVTVEYRLTEYLRTIQDVVQVDLHRKALLQMAKGGLPIPYRCMGDPEMAAFERLAAGKLNSNIFRGT